MASSRKRAADDDFESLYKRLEETVAKLEEGGLTLEQSLALYEEGTKLARRCQELLQKAELRVTRLQEEFSSLREAAEPPYEVEEPQGLPLE